jgi:TPR repeat protein
VAAHGWFLRSAEGGNRNAMLELARIYELGLGVPSDPAEAKAWRQRSGFDK